MKNHKKQARSIGMINCRRNANHGRRLFGANSVKVEVVVTVITIIVAALALLSSSRLGAVVEARRAHSVPAAQFHSTESLANEEADSLAMPIASPIVASSSSSSGSVQCEPIEIGLCRQMDYQTTRMPNFFHDANQIEALDRAPLFAELVKSRCSSHVHAYVCELLTPVCLEESREAMRRFEIYPCRSFCRKVKRDCEHELIKLKERIISEGGSPHLPGFACDSLPFESNGGNGTLRGPCHEIPDLPPSQPQTHLQQQQHHSESNRQARLGGDSYRPYQPALETNVPPFITDISPLDPGAVRPVSGGLLPQQQADGADVGQQTAQAGGGGNSNNMRQVATNRQQLMQPAHANQPGGMGAQLASFAQNVFLALSKYSNYLSILTLFCLLLALSSKRLRSLTNYLRFSSPIGGAGGSDGKSCSSSSSSQRQLTTSNSNGRKQHGVLHSSSIGNGYHQTLAGAKLGMAGVSPSSSSRSLMLIAGSNNGKQAPSHKLMPVELSPDDCEPQKQLLHALGSHKTLINVNANSKNNTITTTLDRQHQQNRYLLLQAAAVRQQQQFNQHHNNNHHHRQHHSLSLRQANQHQFGDTQQLFGTLDSESSQSNHYDYIELPAEQAAREQQRLQQQQQQQQQQARQQQMYSNILLSSPSHQVLLFNSQQQQQRQQQEALQARLAAAQLGTQSPQMGSSSSSSGSSRAAYKHTQNT